MSDHDGRRICDPWRRGRPARDSVRVAPRCPSPSLRRSRSHRGSRPWNPSPAEPGARGILPLDRESGTTVRRNLSAWTPRIHASSRYVVFVIYRLCREMRAEPVIRRRTWHCAPIPPGSFPRSSGRPFPPRFHSSISSMRWRNRSFTVTCRSGSNSAPDALRTYPQRTDRAVQPAREALLPPHRRPLRGRRHGALRLPRHRHLGPDDASRLVERDHRVRALAGAGRDSDHDSLWWAALRWSTFSGSGTECRGQGRVRRDGRRQSRRAQSARTSCTTCRSAREAAARVNMVRRGRGRLPAVPDEEQADRSGPVRLAAQDSVRSACSPWGSSRGETGMPDKSCTIAPSHGLEE